LILLLTIIVTASGACNITSGDATGYVGIPFIYQITASGGARSYSAVGLPPGLSVNTTTGLISGISTTSGTYSVTLGVICNSGSDNKLVTFTITAPSIPTSAFVGFRLPDFLTLPGVPPTYTPRLMLQMGATDPAGPHPFNVTLEVNVPGTTNWVPYNRFVGIDDPASWVTNASLPVRDSSGPTGLPRDFSTAQLTQAPPAVYMKADPRSTRFGIFQMDAAQTSNPSDARTSRIMRSLWPTPAPARDSTVANGYGGNVVDPGGPVEHAPIRFSGSAYYPATFCINGPPDIPPVRDSATTIYNDNDVVTRPADGIYPSTTSDYGSSTPYNTPVYRPIMLNRPFRNVAELGYAFRDLPWKTLDFFTEKSADAGLLDIFTLNDGTQVLGPNDVIRTAMPAVVAGQVNLNGLYVDPNTNKAADGQSILSGAIWDEMSSATVVASGTGAQTAQTMANNIATAMSTVPIQNKSELVTRVDPNTGAKLVETILPPAASDNQAVKTRREVVPRAVSSVSQTRVWNVLIDVVAQSGHYKPNAANLRDDFVVEGEQHYWVHVAIDRFTGQVIDKQIEIVNE
jgi:hypothetical protein